MPRKLLLQLLACMLAVTSWGAGTPLVHAASTMRDEGVTGGFTASQLLAPTYAIDHAALAIDTSYWTEKWLLARHRFAPDVFARAVDSNTTADEATQPVDDTPEPAAKPAAKPAPDSKPDSTPRPQAQPDPTPKPDPTPRPDPTAKPDPTPEPKPEPKPDPSPDYRGTTHFWYPALGISASWRWYGCEYGGNPSGIGAGVYRWGCVGGKNVYLMSHAWSTFAAIRRGYHSGRMDVGQHVWYADGGGNVTEYRVRWIKHVDADYFNRTANDWASESSSSSMMTLQTCDGSNNQYRIIVRLAPV